MLCLIESCSCDDREVFLVRSPKGDIIFASQDVTKVTDFIRTLNKK